MRRELAGWVAGRVVLEAALVEAPAGPKYAGLERAVGQRIERVGRVGKFLILPLVPSGGPASVADPSAEAPGPDGGGRDELVIHLGMTGVISAEPPATHLRVRLALSGGPPDRLYFRDPRRFGRFLVARAGEYPGLPTLARIGPDALDPAFTATALRAALRTSRMAIKTVLLAQRAVAGIGNIYADEALWRARIHPQRPAARLGAADAERLVEALRAVLLEAIEAQGTTLYDYRTVTGQAGGYALRLAVYGRQGRGCPRCGASIRRIVVGARGTHLCPVCQRAPRGIAGTGGAGTRRGGGGPRDA